MQDHYQQLLDATIQHLQDLKARGVRFVSVTRESLGALDQLPPAGKPVQTAHALVAPVFAPPLSPSPRPVPTPVPVERKILFPATAPPPAATLSPEAKAAAMADLRTRALACQKCPHLARSRKNVVFGVGDINATLLFVGEAPAPMKMNKANRLSAGPAIAHPHHSSHGFHAAYSLYRQHLEMPARHPGQTAGNRKPTPDEVHNCCLSCRRRSI